MWCIDEGNWGEKQGVDLEIIPTYYVSLICVYLKSNPELSALTGHPHVSYHAKDGLVVPGELYIITHELSVEDCTNLRTICLI